jgi:hypothetical protein
MDAALNPPVRIQPIAIKPISTHDAQTALESFLSEFQSRGAMAKGGDGAVTVQLQKLADALREERKKK